MLPSGFYKKESDWLPCIGLSIDKYSDQHLVILERVIKELNEVYYLGY